MREEPARRYTVEEANAALPAVRPLVQTLHDAQAVMEERHDEVMASVPTNGGGDVHRAFLRAAESASRSLEALTEMSIVVRDPGSGLIDFPSTRDGREVYLCWRLGEDRVAYWHTSESGFAGREPL
ncbi:MAG TPA: DUF2203 domain-containing protein [Actinomycetota bacterium]